MSVAEEQRLKAAQARHEEIEKRRLERTERREARGIDYQDIVPMAPEDRAQGAPDVATIAATAAASASGGSNATEIAAAVAAAVAQVMLNAQPAMPSAGPKLPSPAVLKRRQEARHKMEDALEEIIQGGGELPKYELLTDLYAGEQLYPATITRRGPNGNSEIRTRITFRGIPNEGMLPLNEPARLVHGLFLESIGGASPDLGDVVHDAYRDRPRHPVGEVVQQSFMGKPVAPEESPVSVLIETPEDEVTYVGPPKVLGTVQAEVPGIY